MDSIMEFLPAILAGFVGALIPTIAAFYQAQKAKAAADGVQNWKDDFFKYGDRLISELGKQPE